MGDVSRTFEELKTQLYAQNVTGDNLNELSMRDLIESIFQYGGLRLSAGQAPNPQTISQDFICLNQYQSLSPPTSSDVNPNSVLGRIVISRGGVYGVNVSLSFSGTNNSEWTGSLFRNDVDMGLCTFVELLRPAGDVSCVGGFDPIVVEAGDELEYRVKANGDNKQFSLQSGQFYVFRIG